MKSIHIRDIDPEVLQRLKKLAEMHHRSMQGELKTIIAEATRKIPAANPDEELDLITVSTENKQSWKREDYYDNAR
ncbi:MAG: Arc family DNA-binding protein [Spirochaetia bacterium]|nr:Arc family DNA-binding protein [Spirochaetia bacterium]